VTPLDNEDMLYFYWAKAMDTTDVEDPQVVQLAVQAHTRAQQSGYLAPPKNVLLPVSETSVGDRISSGTGTASPFTNAGLTQGQMLVSANGKLRLIMQSDGNFVIYEGDRALWASNSNGQGRPPYRLAVQPDRNLVVYGSSDKDVTLSSGICRAIQHASQLGPSASEAGRRRTLSSCRTTAISHSTTARAATCVAYPPKLTFSTGGGPPRPPPDCSLW
jgi:hypothetical protein